MADSPEAIANLAFLVIGDSKGITSLTEGSEEADVANAVYEQDRDEVIIDQSGEQVRLPREVASRVFVAAR